MSTLEHVARDLGISSYQLKRLVNKHQVPATVTDKGMHLDPVAVAHLAEALRTYDDEPRKAKPQQRPKLLTESAIVAKARAYVRAPCGIYFLILGGRIIYVGQAVNIPARIAGHRRAGVIFSDYHWIRCTEERLDIVERSYISTLKPPLNRTHKNWNGPKAD